MSTLIYKAVRSSERKVSSHCLQLPVGFACLCLCVFQVYEIENDLPQYPCYIAT